MSAHGEEEGAICGRSGCDGKIVLSALENCFCHISPPCHSCTDRHLYCESCGWEQDRTDTVNDYVVQVDRKTGVYRSWEPRPLDPKKIDYRNSSHTHFSMIKEGVYPEGTTREQVLSLVEGTFGGRFEYFGGGKFKYIAYTD